MSQRGKLAGFQKTGDTSCRVAVFGTIYDSVMEIDIAPSDAGSTLTMTTRMKRTLPTIVVLVVAFAIFPGVLLTHSMLSIYFSWYPQATWITVAWYVPLTLLAVPAMLAQFRASKAGAQESRKEVLEKIRKTVDAPGA